MIGKDSGWSHVIITVGMCRLVWEVCFVQFSYETQTALTIVAVCKIYDK